VPHRYRVTVAGKAEPPLVHWLEAVIGLLRALPAGWRATLVLERDDD
jgi:hypothetical protein